MRRIPRFASVLALLILFGMGCVNDRNIAYKLRSRPIAVYKDSLYLSYASQNKRKATQALNWLIKNQCNRYRLMRKLLRKGASACSAFYQASRHIRVHPALRSRGRYRRRINLNGKRYCTMRSIQTLARYGGRPTCRNILQKSPYFLRTMAWRSPTLGHYYVQRGYFRRKRFNKYILGSFGGRKIFRILRKNPRMLTRWERDYIRRLFWLARASIEEGLSPHLVHRTPWILGVLYWYGDARYAIRMLNRLPRSRSYHRSYVSILLNAKGGARSMILSHLLRLGYRPALHDLRTALWARNYRCTELLLQARPTRRSLSLALKVARGQNNQIWVRKLQEVGAITSNALQQQRLMRKLRQGRKVTQWDVWKTAKIRPFGDKEAHLLTLLSKRVNFQRVRTAKSSVSSFASVAPLYQYKATPTEAAMRWANTWQTPLHRLAQKKRLTLDDLRVAQALLDGGMNVNAWDNGSRTPLNLLKPSSNPIKQAYKALLVAKGGVNTLPKVTSERLLILRHVIVAERKKGAATFEAKMQRETESWRRYQRQVERAKQRLAEIRRRDRQMVIGSIFRGINQGIRKWRYRQAMEYISGRPHLLKLYNEYHKTLRMQTPKKSSYKQWYKKQILIKKDKDHTLKLTKNNKPTGPPPEQICSDLKSTFSKTDVFPVGDVAIRKDDSPGMLRPIRHTFKAVWNVSKTKEQACKSASLDAATRAHKKCKDRGWKWDGKPYTRVNCENYVQTQQGWGATATVLVRCREGRYDFSNKNLAIVRSLVGTMLPKYKSALNAVIKIQQIKGLKGQGYARVFRNISRYANLLRGGINQLTGVANKLRVVSAKTKNVEKQIRKIRSDIARQQREIYSSLSSCHL